MIFQKKKLLWNKCHIKVFIYDREKTQISDKNFHNLIKKHKQLYESSDEVI